MFRSQLPRKALALRVSTVAGLCVSVFIAMAIAQEGRQRLGQSRQGSQPLVGAQRPGAGVPGNQPGAAGLGASTVHHHYYYGTGANPATAGGAYFGGASGAQGADLSGVTNPAAARGQYNMDTSQAAINLTQASHQSMENHNYAVSSYYNNKDIHDQYMAEQNAKGKVTESEAEYFARQMEPGRLTSAQFDRATSVINWPPLLRDKQFSDVRLKLDQLFHARTPDNSGADSDNFVNIKQACDDMHDILKGMVNDVPSPSYIAASHFIKSVAYEGQFAAK